MYTTRFAPTPSGPLHFGSLVTLTGAWLRARSQGGKFLLRIEDLDTPRCPAGMTSRMLKEIECLGYDHDSDIVIQSQNKLRYLQILKKLATQNEVFKCNCSRAKLKEARCHCINKLCTPEEIITSSTQNDYALRFIPSSALDEGFYDQLLGFIPYKAPQSFGEEYLTLKRRDGIISYALACVVDDLDSGVNEVVRGQDLINATVPQLSLYKSLNAPYPNYLHLPLALVDPTHKLSKQNHATPILEQGAPEQALKAALTFLGQDTDFILPTFDCHSILFKALERFDPQKIPRSNSLAPSFKA